MTGAEPYVPNELLSRLVGNRIYSVEFVLNDYLQLRFDGEPGGPGSIVLNCYVWPTVTVDGRVWRESELGYADMLRRLVPGAVVVGSVSRAPVNAIGVGALDRAERVSQCDPQI